MIEVTNNSKPSADKFIRLTEAEHLIFLQRKAELEVAFALNIQPGQSVMIRAETGHKPYVDLLIDSLKRHGAGEIYLDLDDVRATREMLVSAPQAELERVNPAVVDQYQKWFREGGARIALTGEEFPGLLDQTDPIRRAALMKARRTERATFAEVASKDLSQWLVTACPTPGWAARVFPELPSERQYDALVSAVKNCLRLDQDDPVSFWNAHLTRLEARAELLNTLNIQELHFTGRQSDLKIALSPSYQFLTGGGVSTSGIRFVANIPTEEVFTTPDCRGTEGIVHLTRPVIVNKQVVDGLKLEFRGGEIVSAHAKSGEEAFRAHIAKDASARRLGEVALVGTDSRIFHENRIFYSTLFDENSACHIAIGTPYLTALKNGPKLTPGELASIGCNDTNSPVHDDLMISNETVSVAALTRAGTRVSLLQNGAWVI